jgi:RNA polymerase sigma factor (sigma-70 family)
MIAKHERALRRTARRYSICPADAEDAYQRALEILLVKAPPGDARELVRWMQTVTKHEALAIRRSRERQLGPPVPQGAATEEAFDWLSLIPSQNAGPAERAERREEIARSREALKTLKPAELKALTLLAEGYSYAEIGEMTGFSQTKVNRCLAEGRERFRAFLSRSETGARCAELRPTLSAFCDGEASAEEAAVLREHLRVCGQCRAAMRAYRAAPRAAAALAPAPFLFRSVLERAHDALTSAVGGGGAGSAGLAKTLAICAGAAGGAACVASGIVPPPPGLETDRSSVTAHIVGGAVPESAPAQATAGVEPADGGHPRRRAPESGAVDGPAPDPVPPAEPTTAGAVEYEPPPPEPPPPVPPAPPPVQPAPAPAPEGAETSALDAGSPAGEFGP